MFCIDVIFVTNVLVYWPPASGYSTTRSKDGSDNLNHPVLCRGRSNILNLSNLQHVFIYFIFIYTFGLSVVVSVCLFVSKQMMFSIGQIY